MIADLKPYLEYKASGLQWLGQVPGHWSVLPNRALFSEVKERNHPDEEMLSVTITRGIIRQKLLLANSSKKDSSRQDKSAYKLVKPRDIAYNKMRAWQGAIGASDFCGIISPAYVVMRLRQMDDLPRYFHHLYRTPQFAKEAERWSYGITSDMWSLRPEDFKMIYTPEPPPVEQAAIVRFLDWANGRLGLAIQAKRKVVALLTEQKQAIIHRAVTRGLDPTVSMKDSGIPWLGEIPKHWEVLPLKSVCAIQSGITLGKDYAGQTLREYPYLRVANVQAGHANLTVVKTIRVTKIEAGRCMLQKGDVLMTEGGDPDKLGRGCVWDAQVAPCLHQNHVFAVRLNQSLLEPFFLSALMGTSYARAYFQLTAKQTTNLASTNKTKIGMLKVLLPRVDEQRRILTALEEEARPVTTAIARLEREIGLLREYRTRLVADVVTGKLDVRAAVAGLPEEAAPPGTGPMDEDDAEPADSAEEAAGAADEEAGE
jgi:type I restriction enzyme S subunit